MTGQAASTERKRPWIWIARVGDEVVAHADSASELIVLLRDRGLSKGVVMQALRCDRSWCRSGDLSTVSYGDGKTYWRCPVGHVTPEPPPPDLAAIDGCDADD